MKDTEDGGKIVYEIVCYKVYILLKLYDYQTP